MVAIVAPQTTIISACPTSLTSTGGRLIAVEGCPGPAAPSLPPRPQAAVYSSPRYGFSGPSGIAAGPARLWISNVLGNSVTQLRSGTGKLAATLQADRYGFQGPEALAVGAGELWVANVQANSVIEINASTGSLVRTLSGSAYGFDDPCALALAGRYLWVADARAASVTEIDTASGTPLRVLSGARYGFDDPYALADSATGSGSPMRETIRSPNWVPRPGA